jgi:hypothetical protein
MSITNPVIILGAPRAGTTILNRALSLHPDLWHLPGESHAVLEGPFHPGRNGFDSNRVTADDLDDALAEALREEFYSRAINLDVVLDDPKPLMSGKSLSGRIFRKAAVACVGRASSWAKPESIRLLEKTPRNTLRIPMLNRLFPDAYYLWIKRRAEENIDSLIAGWHAVDRIGPFKRARFAGAGYPIAGQLNLRDYHYKWWKFALVPGWRSLKGKTVADVAAWQYFQCNRFILKDLKAIDRGNVLELGYESFVQNPVEALRQICEWAGLGRSEKVLDFAANLPRINATHPRIAGNGLRYPHAVEAAIKGIPQFDSLEDAIGQ